jgi:hypothetical protein
MSTIRQIILFVLSLALLLLLVKCKHEPVIDPNGPQCGEATTIDEMMEWMYFKTGTYWVYSEQNTGVLDTMTVYYDYNGVSSTGNREFAVKMRSSLDGYTHEYWFNDAWSNECDTYFTDCFCRVVDCDKYKPGDYVGGNHTFIFPLIIGNRAGQQHGLDFGYSTIVSHSDSVIIGDLIFLDVYEFQLDISVQHNFNEATYKNAKKKGFIEKIIPNQNEHWVIVEFEIQE